MAEEPLPPAEDSTTPQDDAPEDNRPKVDVEVSEAGTLKKKVTVTVPRERIDAQYEEMFGELSQSAQVPGFRIGRAPRRLIEKRFGKDIEQDVRNAVLGEALGEGIEQAGLKTLGEPDLDLEEITIPEEGDLTFDFEVEVAPEFDLPEVKGIRVEREPAEVDDERIDEYLDNLRESQARYEKTDEPAEAGDGILASVKITGEDVEHENPRVQTRVAPGVIEGLPLIELETDLAGKKTGETVTITTAAADSHPNEDWRGKELSIELTVHEVNRRILPELDEEFAQARGFDSMKEFREVLGEQLQQRVEQETQNSLRSQICDYLLGNTDFELPEGVIKRYTARMLQRQYIQLLSAGVPQERIAENLAQMQAAAEQRAQRDLKLSFILAKVAEEEQIEVDDDEVNARIAQIATMNNRRPERLHQELAAEGALEQITESIHEEKALDKLLEEADVVEVQPEQKDKDE
jgi:trigger factor